MQRESRPDGLDPQSAQLSRRESYRDRTPSVSGSAVLPPAQLVPEAAYIAPSAAIQIVNSDYVSRGPSWLDHEVGAGGPDLGVSPTSLALVNAFLDSLLFNFLKGARSTSIVALKPAITDVLKPRLARDAIQGADEELRGYLTGGEDEELSDFHTSQDIKGERNLQRVFRTTRLRCMVYTRLGDLEEEDEEMYLEDEQSRDTDDDRRRLSRDLGNVSPAAAIFLTSIIEFIGEQTLMIAAEAAFNRVSTRKPTPDENFAMVEDGDIEKLAFNTTLGRLWRSWKNRVRPSSMLSPRGSIRDLHGRKPSYSTTERASRTTSVSEGDDGYGDRSKRGTAMVEVLHEDQDPATIPLPNPPGFPTIPIKTVFDSRDRTREDSKRPRSMIMVPAAQQSPVEDVEVSPITPDAEEIVQRPRHQRSTSLPLRTTPYVSPMSDTFATPTEGPDPFHGAGEERADAEKVLPRLTDDSQVVQHPGIHKHAVSTMYDGVITGKRQASAAQPFSGKEANSVSDSQTSAANVEDEMTPHAPNFRKTPDAVETHRFGDRQSQASTISSEYSFGAADPAAPTGIFGSKRERAEAGATEAIFSNRGDSLDHSTANFEEDTIAARGASKNVEKIATVQGERLRTLDETGKVIKRDIPVLYEDPSNQDVIYDPNAATRTIRDEVPSNVTSKSTYHGVPPLTPLRELHDAAADTSDEASSIAPSYDISRGDEIPPPDSASHTSESPSRVAPEPAHRKLPPVQTGIERAAVQRVSPSSARSSPYARTSSSSNRDLRPTNSNSTSSKIGKIIGRDSGDAARQPVASRSSAEANAKVPVRYSKTPRTGDRELDFENLIKSDETIQYTLTPQNMREMEASTSLPYLPTSTDHSQNPDSPRWSDDFQPGAQGHLEPDHMDDHLSGDSFATPNPIQPMKGMNGLRSNPATGPAAAECPAPPKPNPLASTARSTRQGPVPKSPAGRASGMPRDATMRDGSMRDFADFIRSTGPDADPGQGLKSNPVAERHARVTNGSSEIQPQQAAATNKQQLRKIAGERVVTAARPQGPPPSRSSSKLKARDATTSPGNTTAELAEFLRSGPPPGFGGADAATRISPGRQVNGFGNGKAIASGSSLASTQDSFAPSKMTQSSANSRTGLLDGTSRSTKNDLQRPNRNDEGPIRKQRRIRDPYDLGTDDNEEENEAQPEREEESLSDFLRNYIPPPESTNIRDVSISTAPPTGSEKLRKSSGPNLRDRIARNIAVVPDYRPLPPKVSKKVSISKSPPRTLEIGSSQQSPTPITKQESAQPPQAQQLRSAGNFNSSNGVNPAFPPNVLQSSPHSVSQNGTYRPTNAPTVRSTHKPKYQAREEKSTRGVSSGMNDLAEFLRDTEPPAPSGPMMRSNLDSMAPEKGLGKMFGRKRKV